MKFARFFLVFTIAFAAFGASAQAGPKPWVWSWWPAHWMDLDFSRPYLEDGKIPNQAQWEGDRWEPCDWMDENHNPQATLDRLYGARIITDQYTDDGVPVLEVGQNFLRLSDEDKIRVAKFVDAAYGMTNGAPDGTFSIRYGDVDYLFADDPTIGIYTRNGLQLQ